MKIISKYKDYYDYLMGIRGIDPLVVLDRREGFVHKRIDLIPLGTETQYRIIRLAICGKLYTGLKVGRKFVWGEKLLEYGELKNGFDKNDQSIHFNDSDLSIPYEKYEKVDFNDEANCPILFINSTDRYNFLGGVARRVDISYDNFPQLKVYGVQKWYKAEKIYNDISNWISKRNEKHIPDNRTDIEKIHNAGFDKKTSFRRM